MNRCVITPTYKNHFPFIERYLESFDKYLLDREFPIYFVVSRSDLEQMQQLAAPYADKLNLSVILFEDVLAAQGITASPDDILQEIGRLSFQTIKKFYSALYIGAEQFFVLDSESIMIAPTNLNELFDRYFAKPEFFISRLQDRPRAFRDRFTYCFMTSASEITHYPPIHWPLESYNWFLELKVLKKMIEKYGDLYQVIRQVKLPGKYHDEGIEGELLYYPYILHTPGQFGYRIYDMLAEIKKYIGPFQAWLFQRRFHNSWRAHGGFMEGLACFVTRQNVKGLTTMMQAHCMPVFRISRVIRKDQSCLDLQAQMQLVEQAGVQILASSYTEPYYEKYVNPGK